MAVESSLPALLATLTQSLSSALESSPDNPSIIPPKDGISLLDVKNELLLSYLQNLVFLIILKLRNRKTEDEEEHDLDNTVVKKLVELRVYLEKGVRPLEGRLKYQIDKVLRAADDAARVSAPKLNSMSKKTKDGSEDESESEDSEEDSDAESMNGVSLKAPEIDDLQYRPNPSSLIVPSSKTAETATSSTDGVYRPPRITAMSMPTTTGPREKESRKPNKSATLDEYISTEMSTAPLAEPSIGSTITGGGRRSKSDKEKRDEAERREYEERNYIRLPKESKKERAKKGGRKQDAGYGGEEWRGLGEGIDRIERLTKRKGGDARNVLEKSRKRPVEDGPRDSGTTEAQQRFQKRIKSSNGARRDRGRK